MDSQREPLRYRPTSQASLLGDELVHFRSGYVATAVIVYNIPDSRVIYEKCELRANNNRDGPDSHMTREKKSSVQASLCGTGEVKRYSWNCLW